MMSKQSETCPRYHSYISLRAQAPAQKRGAVELGLRDQAALLVRDHSHLAHELAQRFASAVHVEQPQPLHVGDGALVAGHTDDDTQPAQGWITALERRGEKLVATLSQVPDELVDAIKAGRFRHVSI